MDLSADAGTLPSHATVGGCVPERELSLSSARGQTESGSTILLQLLEFKTHLLEAVEELHIRRALPLSGSRFVVVSLSGRREVEKRGDVRIVPDIPEQDAETRFEDQISKLVLEKQELEWAKESLQHQIETAANQHTESLIAVKKQFQAKIRNIEEEKGKYRASAELKDKEINNLKEELKSLQLLKYNLEKKSSELEQKLVLQSRSKDSHLNQLGEVEKRFSAVSRQCAMVKQAHEKLEQNVDEAIKRNKKLTSANEKQEATIVSLKKELEEVSNNLIKAKMSAIRHDKSCSPTGREQRIQQLHQKLNMEAEMNKKLREENAAVRAEKQEVMKSLQHTQQLLLSQTQTVSRVELELQTQREQCQALKQEHEVMREKSKATEDKVVQLMESYAASKTSWDKEKRTFLERVRSEQLGFQAVSKAYGELHQKHARHMSELQRRDSSQSLSVSNQLYATLVEDIRGGETLNEPISSSETPGFGCLQSLASAQTKKPDRLEDAGAETKLVTTGATGGQHASDHHLGSQLKHALINPPNASNSKHISLRSVLGTSGGDTSILNNCINSSNTHDPDTYSDLIHTTSSESADGLLIRKGSLASSPGYRSSSGCVDPHSKKKSDGGKSEREQGWKDGVKPGGNTREEEKGNEELRCNGEEVQGEHVKEGGSVAEKRGMLMAQTTDRADRLEDSQRSTKDAGDTKQSKTETKDRAGGEGADGVEEGRMERGKTGPCTPETQIPAQTATDTTTEKSNTWQVIDFMDTEPPLATCEPSDSSQSHSQKVSEEVADSSHVNNGCEIRGGVNSCCSDEHRSVSHGPDSVFPHLRPDEDQTFAQDLGHQVVDQTTGEKPADIPTELCSPQTHTAALTAHSDDNVCIQGLDTTATQAQPCNPFGIITNIKQAEETCDIHMREDCVSVSTMFEPQALPQTQEISEQECGQLTSLVTDDDDDSSAYKKEECQSDVDTRENDTQGPVETSDLKDACVDIMMDAVDLESGLGAGSCQEHVEKDKGENAGDAKTTQTVIHPISEIDASPETSSAKCHEPSPAGEDTSESSLHSSKKYRSSFDWASTQRITGCTVSERNTGELLRQPSSTVPTFLKSKHSRVPSVITGTSGVCGTAASSRRHQQAEWRAIGGTCRETATADTESRASLSFPTSSITERRLSWQTTPGCSRAPTLVAGPSLESFWEPSCSQETEDQQSSLRAQISKIEQFLSAERLRLPKRRKTEN